MDFDLIIVGGGLVGASLALALKASGLKQAIVETAFPTGVDSTLLDSRVSTISPGSIEFLESCGAWARLDKSRVTSVREMRVTGDDDVSILNFDAYRQGVSKLACVVENLSLQNALRDSLNTHPTLNIFCPAQCASLRETPDYIELELSDGTLLHTKLLIGADGTNSWVRAHTGFLASVHPYRQTGIVANFAAEKPHGDTAWQWFRNDGVLALLPLPGNKVSMVWSVDQDRSRALMELTQDAFSQSVQEASQFVLGALRLENTPQAFPLQLLRVENLVKQRVALIGDAAHTVHPLAGQGVNLGFQDARSLASVLMARKPQQDCGDYFLLRRYERSRKEDILAMQLVTDGLQKLFCNQSSWLSRPRNLGLKFTDHLPLIKKLLVQHALK